MNKCIYTEPYLGKTIKSSGQKYKLVEPIKSGYCKGCALYYRECPKQVVEQCVKGYILEKI